MENELSMVSRPSVAPPLAPETLDFGADGAMNDRRIGRRSVEGLLLDTRRGHRRTPYPAGVDAGRVAGEGRAGASRQLRELRFGQCSDLSEPADPGGAQFRRERRVNPGEHFDLEW